MSLSTHRRQWSACGVCHGGRVALVFGLSLVPVALAAGLSLDYARALNTRLLLHDATKAAAIAGARLPLDDMNKRKSAAKAAFDASISRSQLEGIEPEISAAEGELIVEASYSMPTVFTSIAGIMSMDLKATTRALASRDGSRVPPAPQADRK